MNRLTSNAARRLSTLAIAGLTAVGLFTLGCSSKQVYEGNSAVVHNDSANPTAELQVEWVKNKEDSVDMLVWITNISKSQFYVKQSSFHIDFAGQKTSAFNTPAFVELQPGERRQLVLIFKLGRGKPASGIVTLTVDPITEGQIEKPGASLAPLKLKLPVAADP